MLKTCPNCGAQMGAEVNFCTACGTDIRNMPVQASQNNANLRPEPEPQVNQPSQPVRDVNSLKNQMQQPTYPTAQNQTFNKVTQAVKNFDKESLWKWFTTSWKTPSAEQQGENWYGIATLLIEMILFSWTFVAGMKNFFYQSVPTEIPNYYQQKINGFFRSLSFDQFLIVLITGAGVIGGSYFARKFVYNTDLSIWKHINKVVQLSNINVGIVILIALFSLMDFKGTMTIIFCLMFFAAILILMAGVVSIRSDQASVRDPFYGVILYLLIVAVSIALAYLITKGQLISQVQSAFDVDISKFFDPNNLHF